MATQGTDYFALFMMNNQDRITRSLTQARRELDYAKAGQEFQRQYLMDQIAAEQKALAKIRTTKVTALSGGRGRGKSQTELLAIGKAKVTAATALKGVTSERQKAGTAAISAYDIDGPQFMESYLKSKQQHLTGIPGGRIGAADYLEKYKTLVGKDMKIKVGSLSPKQQNEAVALMATDIMTNVPGQTESRAMQMAANFVGLSSEGMAGPAELPQRKMQEAEAAKAAIRGEAVIEEGLEDIRAIETGTGAATGPVKTTAPYLKEQATAAEDRIAALEDQLEELALDPVRMEDIRTRAGEIHAPYMRKKKQKEIEYAKTLRAMSLKGWQKNFAAAGVLGGQYADQIANDGEDFRTGSTGQSYGTNLFSLIEKKEMTLPEAMNKISSSDMSAEEQKKAVAVLVAQGILGSRRDNGPPVPGQRELEEDIRKAAKQSEEAWLEQATQDLWGEEQPTPKRGRTSQAPAEQEQGSRGEFSPPQSTEDEMAANRAILADMFDRRSLEKGRSEYSRSEFDDPEASLEEMAANRAILAESMARREEESLQQLARQERLQQESLQQLARQERLQQESLHQQEEYAVKIPKLKQALQTADSSYEWQPEAFIERIKTKNLLPDERARLKTLSVPERMNLVELIPGLNETQKTQLKVYLQWGLD